MASAAQSPETTPETRWGLLAGLWLLYTAFGLTATSLAPLVTLIEADLEAGVIAVPLSKYADFNTRICRPVGLTPDEREQVVRFMLGNLGKSYDLKHVFDLARYLLATPPVPSRYRRRMLALGSGDPTRAICSTLIAQAFQGIRYPVLPSTERIKAGGTGYDPQEVLRIRHHSLFVPRDFDLSPYFRVVKPTIEAGFNHRELVWAEQDLPSDGAIGESTPVAGS